MSRDRDYYSVLQVSRGANQDAIERAYERLSRLYDPASSRKPKASLRMQELNEAYEVLSDRQKRAEYDRRGKSGLRSGGGAEAAGLAATGFLSSPFFFAGATVIGVVVVTVALVLLSVFGGDDDGAVVTQPSITPAGTPGPSPTPGPTPPPVTGDEIATASGLKYIVIQPGTGATPQQGQTVVANYTGWRQSDGFQFDTSLDGSPFDFVLGTGAVIKGWDEAFATMQVGEKRRLIIPPDLAYGPEGRGANIPPNSTLLFDVELVSIQ